LSAHGVTLLSAADFLAEKDQKSEHMHNESTGQSKHGNEFSDGLLDKDFSPISFQKPQDVISRLTICF
jgi:hypothetical protein